MLSTITTVETENILPWDKVSKGREVKLSILDAKAQYFTPGGCIWFYNRQKYDPNDIETTFKHLKRALSLALEHYPQFTGQLTKRSDIHQQNVPYVSFGHADDPGFQFILAKDSRRVNDLVDDDPYWKNRIPWRPVSFDALYPASNINFYSEENDSAVVAAAQVTEFSCRNWSLAVKINHCLADATTLMHFVGMWSAFSNTNLPHMMVDSPIFEPDQLDTLAFTRAKHQTRIDRSRSLPIHRYNLWHGKDTEIPEGINLSPANEPPWSEWNMSLPVEVLELVFSSKQVANMKEDASRSGNQVSRQDALLAHIWTLVNRARGVTGPTFLNFTLGARTRVSPPLAPSFAGSPTFIAYVERDGDTEGSDIAQIASSIRKTIQIFDHEAVTDMLHDAAQEYDPARIWQGFLGSHHILCTSWTGLALHNVSFYPGRRPRYYQAMMPVYDGLLQILDNDHGHYRVSLSLEAEASRRLEADPMLRKYRA